MDTILKIILSCSLNDTRTISILNSLIPLLLSDSKLVILLIILNSNLLHGFFHHFLILCDATNNYSRILKPIMFISHRNTKKKSRKKANIFPCWYNMLQTRFSLLNTTSSGIAFRKLKVDNQKELSLDIDVHLINDL